MKTRIWSKLGFKKGQGSHGSSRLYQCLLRTLMGTSNHFIHPRSALEPTSEHFKGLDSSYRFLQHQRQPGGSLPALRFQHSSCDLWLTLGSGSGGLKLSFGMGAQLFPSPNAFREIGVNPTPLQWASCFL